MIVTLDWYIVLSCILFGIGAIGVLTRRNAIVIFMSIELMLNATNINFVAFSSYLGNLSGQVFVFFALMIPFALLASCPSYSERPSTRFCSQPGSSL